MQPSENLGGMTNNLLNPESRTATDLDVELDTR
jgi:hypothetical protein